MNTATVQIDNEDYAPFPVAIGTACCDMHNTVTLAQSLIRAALQYVSIDVAGLRVFADYVPRVREGDDTGARGVISVTIEHTESGAQQLARFHVFPY